MTIGTEPASATPALRFTLPIGWRGDDGDGAPPGWLEVTDGDLPGGFAGLATSYQAELSDVLLAAHATVLGMLGDGSVAPIEALRPTPAGTPCAAVLEPDAATWRDRVTAVQRATWSPLPAPADEPHPGGVLFSAAAPPPAGGTAADGYGLVVSAGTGGPLRLQVAPGHLTRGYLDRLAQMYRAVLTAMATDPAGDARRAHLPAADRQAVLERWSTGPSVTAGPGTLPELIRAQVARTPHAVAVRAPDGSQTYAELQAYADRLSLHLLARGVVPGTLVGVCLRRSVDLLPTLLAVWGCGAGYVPLDPDLPPERLRRMIGSAGCRLVVATTAVRATLDSFHHVPQLLLDQERDQLNRYPATPPDIRIGAGQLAYVIYTSGSTGTPKGVMVQHDSLTNYLRWTADAYAAHGTGGSPYFTSISFDLQIPSLFTPLLTGQAVHLLPDPLVTADLGDQLVAGARYSFIKLTPGHLNLLSLDLSPDQIRGLAGVVIAAGDSFPAALAHRWITAAGPGGTAVATEYGPTEITIGNSGQVVTRVPTTELVPLGLPIPNTTMYVLTDRLEPVPVGVAGEIYIGGAGVARGYLGDPALTAARFLPDPYGRPGDRCYRTGDRGRWRADGALEFLGRVDHQVKIRGYRVELGEVRAVLRRCAEVRDAVVVPQEQPGRPTRLVAFVVATPGRTVDPARLRRALAVALPDYMVPHDFVTVEDLPLTANGKIDTRLLRSHGEHRIR